MTNQLLFPPAPARIREAVRQIKNAASTQRQETGGTADLNMSLAYAQREPQDHACQTVACIGGWGNLAFSDALSWKEVKGKAVGVQFLHCNGALVDYADGSNLFAEKVLPDNAPRIFEHRHLDLSQWATDNPHLWGNARGDAMFGSSEAYELDDTMFRSSQAYQPKDRKPVDLDSVLRWWLDVADRIETSRSGV